MAAAADVIIDLDDLGLRNYFHLFVAEYVQIAQPLTNLTHKGISFVWLDAYALPFDQLKWVVSIVPVVVVFDRTRPMLVAYDASSFVVGAIWE